MERRINNIEVKNLMDAVGKAFFDFESKARPGTKGGTEEEALAKFTQLNNEIDALELSFTKLVNASRATNTDREHYEAMRQKSGEESDAVSQPFPETRRSSTKLWAGFWANAVFSPRAQVNRTIEAKKVELEEASKVREFYLECEKLKEGIVQIPSCSKLNKNIAETRKEAETIKERETKADVLNEVRRDGSESRFFFSLSVSVSVSRALMCVCVCLTLAVAHSANPLASRSFASPPASEAAGESRGAVRRGPGEEHGRSKVRQDSRGSEGGGNDAEGADARGGGRRHGRGLSRNRSRPSVNIFLLCTCTDCCDQTGLSPDHWRHTRRVDETVSFPTSSL